MHRKGVTSVRLIQYDRRLRAERTSEEGPKRKRARIRCQHRFSIKYRQGATVEGKKQSKRLGRRMHYGMSSVGTIK